MKWDFDKYGFKLIWDFPENDEPHCEVLLRMNNVTRKDRETLSFSGTPLPWKNELGLLKNLRKSLDATICEIEDKTK